MKIKDFDTFKETTRFDAFAIHRINSTEFNIRIKFFNNKEIEPQMTTLHFSTEQDATEFVNDLICRGAHIVGDLELGEDLVRPSTEGKSISKTKVYIPKTGAYYGGEVEDQLDSIGCFKTRKSAMEAVMKRMDAHFRNDYNRDFPFCVEIEELDMEE